MAERLATITYSFPNARNAAQAFRRASVEVSLASEQAIKAIGSVAESGLKRVAPSRTGRLRASIARIEIGRGGRTTVIVGANARDPNTGFDYVPITRFGHHVAWIYPRADRAPASVIATKKLRAIGRNAALRFVIDGRVFYRRRVRGYHPAVDWASEADLVIDAAIAVQSARVRARVERIIQS